MASKMVLDPANSASKVAQAAETHAVEVAAKLNPLLASVSDVAPDIGPLIRAFGALVIQAAEAMVQTDEAHEVEVADDVAPRAARDEAVRQVYALLTELRAAVNVAFGERAVSGLGFSGPTPQDPAALLALAKGVAHRIPGLRDAKPRSTAFSIDWRFYDAALPGPTAALAAALEDVRRESREAESTHKAKQRALANYDERFSLAATAPTVLFRLAGETELAERVRPSATRPGRTHSETDPEQPEAPVV
jgi:hypothetical protein